MSKAAEILKHLRKQVRKMDAEEYAEFYDRGILEKNTTEFSTNFSEFYLNLDEAVQGDCGTDNTVKWVQKENDSIQLNIDSTFSQAA